MSSEHSVEDKNRKEVTLNAGLPPYHLGPCVRTAAIATFISLKSRKDHSFAGLT